MSLGLGVLLLLKEVCVLFLLNTQIHIKSDLNFLFRKNYILKKVLFCVSMTEIISSVTVHWIVVQSLYSGGLKQDSTKWIS